jgi:hypothetical protein
MLIRLPIKDLLLDTTAVLYLKKDFSSPVLPVNVSLVIGGGIS